MDAQQSAGLSPLYVTSNFVKVDDSTFDDFHKFKDSNIRPSLTYLRTCDLLDIYFRLNRVDPILYRKFGFVYYMLTPRKIDSIIEWIYDARDRFPTQGKAVFEL